ncbi:FMN-binding negative transcriptional regulator [Shewanella sp.]|uniref:FMN-binding negative transcriptional regulator n=1 Tax=Shewanella sp. TaxID=50422 RepID=UPI0040549AF7
MYIPKNMLMDDVAVAAFIQQFSFAALVTSDLNISHLPFLFQPQEGENGVLYGHMARANGQHKMTSGGRVVVIFNGPHAYVSPTWYQNQPAVPTWNYAAVHCYGELELLDGEQTEQLMRDTVAQYEPSLLDNKTLMPDEYLEKMRQAIVGFKIVVDDIQAKEKLGQHRKLGDQQGVFAALKQSAHLDAKQLAQYMELRGIGLGEDNED